VTALIRQAARRGLPHRSRAGGFRPGSDHQLAICGEFAAETVGRAFGSALMGDPRGALAALEGIGAGGVNRQWLAVVEWIRGRQLYGLGEAEAAYEHAESSLSLAAPTFRSVAKELRLACLIAMGRSPEALDQHDPHRRRRGVLDRGGRRGPGRRPGRRGSVSGCPSRDCRPCCQLGRLGRLRTARH
jgi:hypothetical protein